MNNTNWESMDYFFLKKDSKLGVREVGMDLRGVKKRSWGEYDQNMFYGILSGNIFKKEIEHTLLVC